MGEFSGRDWIIVLFTFAGLAMIIHIAVSSRTQGWNKAFFVIAALLIPVLPYLLWLGVRDSAAEASSSARVKEEEAPAREAEAEAGEAEARARIAKAGSVPPRDA